MYTTKLLRIINLKKDLDLEFQQGGGGGVGGKIRWRLKKITLKKTPAVVFPFFAIDCVAMVKFI